MSRRHYYLTCSFCGGSMEYLPLTGQAGQCDRCGAFPGVATERVPIMWESDAVATVATVDDVVYLIEPGKGVAVWPRAEWRERWETLPEWARIPEIRGYSVELFASTSGLFHSHFISYVELTNIGQVTPREWFRTARWQRR